MYYTIYKTTNDVNGKVYIGCHKTEDLEDDYMGSGKILKRAIEKHGVENFTKEIIEVFDNPKDMFNMESQLVNEDFIVDKETYNLKVGGEGGFDFVNSLGNQGKRLNENLSDEKRKLGSKNSWISRKDSWMEKHKSGELKKNYFGNCVWHEKANEKAHSFEANEKRKKTLVEIKHQQGKNNSQYGSCWISFNGVEKPKKIKKKMLPYFIDQGWIKGRKQIYR